MPIRDPFPGSMLLPCCEYRAALEYVSAAFPGKFRLTLAGATGGCFHRIGIANRAVLF